MRKMSGESMYLRYNTTMKKTIGASQSGFIESSSSLSILENLTGGDLQQKRCVYYVIGVLL